VARIREEENNFQAALDWLQRHEVEEAAQIPLAYIVGENLFRKGHFADAVPYYRKSIELAEGVDDLWAQVSGLNGLANLYIEKGENRPALVAAEKAEALAQGLVKGHNGGGEGFQSEGRLELVTALTLKGWALSRLGEFDDALPVAERAVALSNESGGAMAKLVAMNLLAYLYDDVGRYQEGSVYHLGAITIARENGDRPWEAVLLNNLAESYKMMGNFEGALKVFDEAYRVSRLIGYRHISTLVLVNSGDAHLEMGRIEKAESCFRQVLDEIGDKPPFFLAYCYALLGRACALQGKLEEGLSFAQASLKIAEEMENPEDMAAAWLALADIARKNEAQVVVIGRRPYSPRACYQECARFFEENGQEVEWARLLVKWAEFERAAGDEEKAEALVSEAKKVFTQFDLPLFLASLEKVVV
jgi:tetratricopeptide (TPR) repeat protein